MADASPAIFWFKNDLRLQDNPALSAACDTGQPVIPVYILDDHSPGQWKRGGASRWWLHQSLQALSDDIDKAGLHPLVLLRGEAKAEILALCGKTGAKAVFWNRSYEPWAMRRDKQIKEELKTSGIDASSFGGFLLWEPWELANKTGQPYKVFTPFSRACLERSGIRPLLTKKIKSQMPDKPVKGLPLKSLELMPDIKWYKTMETEWQPGEAGGRARLKEFIGGGLHNYKGKRDFPGIEGSSRLSPYLHFGELSPQTIWHSVSDAIAKSGNAALQDNGQAYLRQLIWRDFSWHLLYHFPTFPEKSWNPQFENFEWQKNPKWLKKWQRGLTGYPIIDAGMRQLWQTGWMHNRVRMLVGSFLVKNLLLDWRQGEDWFWDTLVDADLGNNAQGWQWIAGCGADAAPYFRIFNPILQSRKFDASGDYIRKYVPEIAALPDEYIHAPWEAPAAVLSKAGVKLGKDYPEPIIDHATARDRALEAYRDSKPAEKRVHLSDRAVLRIAGEDAKNFLQNIITNDMDKMSGGILYACLLSPQGQYLHDFFIIARDSDFLLDVEAFALDDLMRRLMMFKLRAKVSFDNLGGKHKVFAVGTGEGMQDPRLPALGARLYVEADDHGALPVAHYHDFCIDFIIPCGSLAMTPRDTMADVNLDHLNAVAWDKGCFIGQEVAARMHHRGLAKKRLFRIDGPDLVAGEKLLQNGREVGEIRQVNQIGDRAIAQIKLAAASNALLPVLTTRGNRVVVTAAKYLESATG